MVTISDSEDPITREELDDFLATVSGNVPASYQDFMLSNNGGSPSPDVFKSSEDDTGLLVHQFYSIKYGDLLVENLLKIYHDLGRPDYLLPFASDEGGNHFCINLKEGASGEICMFYTDGASDVPIPIASSFDAFLAGITEPDEDEYEF